MTGHWKHTIELLIKEQVSCSAAIIVQEDQGGLNNQLQLNFIMGQALLTVAPTRLILLGHVSW